MISTSYFVLGVHPAAQGFGWALFDGPNSLFDWGTADIRKADSAKTLVRIAQLFDKYQPRVLALEEFDSDLTRRRPRIRLLCRAIVGRAELRNIWVLRYHRDQIAAVHGQARSRFDIATMIAARFDNLAPLLPKKRRLWENERLGMSIFNAAACASTYYVTSLMP